MKGSDGDSSQTPETPTNPMMRLSFEQACLLTFEHSNRELKESMTNIIKMVQN